MVPKWIPNNNNNMHILTKNFMKHTAHIPLKPEKNLFVFLMHI